MAVDLAERIAALDIALFEIESETNAADRRSLLAIHAALAGRHEPFSYLEIGSHLGGTVQVYLADPRCSRVVSIDPRPSSQPDDRAGYPSFDYIDNSTERMLALLRDLPGCDLSKLETVEASTKDIAPGRFARPDLCFV